VRALAASGSASVGLAIGVVAGPYGLHVWEQSQTVVAACRGLILEWTTPLHDELIVRWLPPTLVVAGVVLLSLVSIVRTALREPSSLRSNRLIIALVVAAVPFTLASFVAIRFLGIAGLTMAPVIAWWLARLPGSLRRAALRRSSEERLSPRLREWTSARFWRVILTATLAVLAPFTVAYAWPHSQPPTAALNALLPTECRLFSPSNEAAAVILTRPDVPVWFDGRADYYGRARLEAMSALVYETDPDHPVPDGATCVLLPGPGVEPDYAALVAALDQSPLWQRVAESNGYILWLPADKS